MIKIAPSILASDFSRLAEEVKKLELAGVDMIHIDVMDGHFVPNITLGPPVVNSLRKETWLKFDVHLMIEKPEKYIESFADAGADSITVHVEACTHLHRTIQQIKNLGKQAGVALNPATPPDSLQWILGDVDMVLLMTVNPGFGGQTYIRAMTDKIRNLKKMCGERGLKPDIQVDGGIDVNNISVVTAAGANVIVAGTAIFNAVDVKKAVKELREYAAGGKMQ